MVKLTAYDFATFGGLHGKVTSISADTTQDKKGNDFYLVRIKTDTNYILSQTGAKLPIIPGMTANVDIITGKRTILSYLLNPLLRLQQTALTE
ncbi:hypothetical protein [Shewanella marina]|uniref:hypothetical protein n=1 Tax=Shewanella marina TaxID=487319 RepID=UPI000A78BBB7|nr:hypothetical protein [Shewanella marina]